MEKGGGQPGSVGEEGLTWPHRWRKGLWLHPMGEGGWLISNPTPWGEDGAWPGCAAGGRGGGLAPQGKRLQPGLALPCHVRFGVCIFGRG